MPKRLLQFPGRSTVWGTRLTVGLSWRLVRLVAFESFESRFLKVLLGYVSDTGVESASPKGINRSSKPLLLVYKCIHRWACVVGGGELNQITIRFVIIRGSCASIAAGVSLGS